MPHPVVQLIVEDVVTCCFETHCVCIT